MEAIIDKYVVSSTQSYIWHLTREEISNVLIVEADYVLNTSLGQGIFYSYVRIYEFCRLLPMQMQFFYESF